MSIIMTAREFNQHASRALKLAQTSPVFITKWGKIIGVVSNYQTYQERKKGYTLAEAFAPYHAAAEVEDFDEELSDIRKNTTFRVTELE